MPMKKVCPRCGATFDCMHNDILSCHCATVRLYNPQIEMFARFKMKSSFHKTKRII